MCRGNSAGLSQDHIARRAQGGGQRHQPDNCPGQNCSVLRIAIVVLSYIPDSSFASHGRSALELWRTVLDSCAYPLAPLPIIVTSKPLGHLGKHSALRYIRNHLFWSHDLELNRGSHYIPPTATLIMEAPTKRHLVSENSICGCLTSCT